MAIMVESYGLAMVRKQELSYLPILILVAEGSRPSSLVEFNNQLYFTANDGTNGNELWTTDGTTAGTQLVADINPGAGDSVARYSGDGNLTVFDSELFFVADNGVTGQELYKLTDNGAVDPVDPSPTASIIGTAGEDNLQGTAANEFIASGAGNDILVGGAGNDTLSRRCGN